MTFNQGKVQDLEIEISLENFQSLDNFEMSEEEELELSKKFS